MPLSSSLTAAVVRVQAAVLAGVLALPAGVQRRIAGPPVVIDGATLDLETQLTLRLKTLLREPAAESLPIPRGREQMRKEAQIVAGRLPVGSVRQLVVERADDALPARLYVPRAGSEALLVFFHGGGFVYGDLDSHDGVCRFLAETAGVRVLAVEYRLAPEAPFPAAYDDATAAYRWVVEHVAELGADPARLAVGGDSAGGALAAATALMAAREGLPLAFQLLVYPATDLTNSSESHARFGNGFYLTTELKDIMRRGYLPDSADWKDPRASVLYAEVPPGLAPAYICTAGFDPLRDEGEAYARKLADAGVAVEVHRFPDLIHGFLNWVSAGTATRAAARAVAGKLRAGLAG